MNEGSGQLSTFTIIIMASSESKQDETKLCSDWLPQRQGVGHVASTGLAFLFGQEKNMSWAPNLHLGTQLILVLFMNTD